LAEGDVPIPIILMMSSSAVFGKRNILFREGQLHDIVQLRLGPTYSPCLRPVGE
jgi:hypothetical protein